MRNFLHGDMEFPYLRTPMYYSLGNSLKFSRSPLVHRSVCTVTYKLFLESLVMRKWTRNSQSKSFV